jgi:coenzyme F420 hydrogenase subunit delta
MMKTSAMSLDVVPAYCTKPVVIFGCGNILLGDDGFGPAVAEKLRASDVVPAGATVIDAGTSVREFLFDITLSEQRPSLIVVIDAVDVGRPPGEVFKIPLDDIPIVNIPDYSLHQAPTSNLLRELRDHCGVEVVVIACQVGDIPDEVKMGLTPAVEDAVVCATKLVEKSFLRQEKPVKLIETKKR